MALTLQNIIDEAATLVPNEVPVADQVVWLNAINQDFFNIVKIPQVALFTGVRDQGDYVLSANIREKNVDIVMCGVLKYRDFQVEDASPLQNTYAFDDSTHTLTLNPAPYNNGLRGLLRYRRIATTTFTSGDLDVTPDCPEEYQWTYIPALAAYLADTQDDTESATKYENQYKAAWNKAAVDYG